MNQQVVWYIYDIVTLFVIEQTLSKLIRKKGKITISSWFYFKNKTLTKKNLNHDYEILKKNNKRSDSIEVTLLPNYYCTLVKAVRYAYKKLIYINTFTIYWIQIKCKGIKFQ